MAQADKHAIFTEAGVLVRTYESEDQARFDVRVKNQQAEQMQLTARYEYRFIG